MKKEVKLETKVTTNKRAVYTACSREWASEQGETPDRAFSAYNRSLLDKDARERAERRKLKEKLQ